MRSKLWRLGTLYLVLTILVSLAVIDIGEQPEPGRFDAAQLSANGLAYLLAFVSLFEQERQLGFGVFTFAACA